MSTGFSSAVPPNAGGSSVRDGSVGRRRVRAVLRGLVFILCCAADAFVLSPLWTGRQLAEGQFRRGYFERFGSEVGLAMDTAIRPVTIPSFVLTEAGDLALPPGMIAVVPIAPGTTYQLQPA